MYIMKEREKFTKSQKIICCYNFQDNHFNIITDFLYLFVKSK